MLSLVFFLLGNNALIPSNLSFKHFGIGKNIHPCATITRQTCIAPKPVAMTLIAICTSCSCLSLLETRAFAPEKKIMFIKKIPSTFTGLKNHFSTFLILFLEVLFAKDVLLLIIAYLVVFLSVIQ